MKSLSKKIMPYALIFIGALRLLAEKWPEKLGFLRILGGDSLGWIFWTVGIAGIIWLAERQFSPGSREQTGDEPVQQGFLPRFFHRYGIELLILLITAASLSMLIRSGYFWDDAVNSTAYLAEKKDAVPTFTQVLDFMKKYLELGRINILSIYYYFFFYIENVSVYKALIILTILADQLILRKVLLEYKVSLSGARLGMLLIPLLLQTRAYQDPVSGFYSLMQVLTAEMLLCALFLHRWLESDKNRHLCLALLFYALGLLTYEVCFPFLAMICLLILCRRKNFLKTLRSSLPFLCLTGLMLAAVFLVRRLFFRVDYPGVAFSLDPLRVLRAGFTQLMAGLPLSFYSAHYQAAVMGNAYPAETFMNYGFFSFLKAIRFSDILIIITALFVLNKIYSTAFRSDTGTRLKSHTSLLILGFSFAVLPMITVAMSERYQGQLMPGLGYLPVYMQYYGIAILLLCLLLAFRPNHGNSALFLSFFIVVLLLNLQNNRAVTAIMNRSFYESRNAGENALHGGILDFLPSDAVLVSVNDRRYIWESDWLNRGLYKQFYGNNAKRIPETVGDTGLLRSAAASSPDEEGFVKIEPENVWLIDYSGSSERGFARLGKLERAELNIQTLEIKAAETGEVLYFVSGVYPEQEEVQYITTEGTFRQLRSTDMMRVRQNRFGILYKLPESEEIIFDSLTPSKVSKE